MNLASALTKLGHDVTLLALKGTYQTRKSDFKFYSVRKFKLKKFGNFSMSGKMLFLIYSVFQSLVTKPNLIITRYPLGGLIFLELGFKVVIDAHHKIWDSHSKIGRVIHLSIFNFVKDNPNLVDLTTNSEALKQSFSSHALIPKCGITTAHNGSRIYPTNQYFKRFQRTSRDIGYIGGFYHGRGLDTIIKISTQLPKFNFRLAGGTKDELVDLYPQLNIPKNLKCYGFVEPCDAYLFRNSCDILLAPYQQKGVSIAGNKNVDTSDIMNPIKIYEAFSSKSLLIVSDLKVINEILPDGVCIYLDPDKIEEWISSVITMINYPERRKIIEQRAYAYFEKNLTWEKRAEKILKKYLAKICFK